MSVLPEQISQLETSVAAQFSGAQEYNLSEMMNLLKFYNFDPVEVGTEAAKARGLIVARIIIKSLTVSPRADAAAACYLLSATLVRRLPRLAMALRPSPRLPAPFLLASGD